MFISYLIFPIFVRGDICQIETPYLVQKRGISDTPNYFFRAFPDSNKVSYATEGGNKILDLDSGVDIAIPGRYDPVPTWDEQIMTVPQNGMKFFRIDDLLKEKGYDEAKILQDNDLRGVYQSIATLETNGNESTIRIITDRNNISYRDYKIKKQRRRIRTTPHRRRIHARSQPEILTARASADQLTIGNPKRI